MIIIVFSVFIQKNSLIIFKIELIIKFKFLIFSYRKFGFVFYNQIFVIFGCVFFNKIVIDNIGSVSLEK